ncbi:hypothetical protein [Bergeriella denitrificans]|uniref:Uncharacterized protein n=1 Tax=Bergeriella denitrificans TaxID=494 RepID=A0A378UHW2_BERDE|nr:hypothetical protein [Bergeriella denitrificans]STZ76750.1 Uncharacterised protein [Bergeriella denitrificans]
MPALRLQMLAAAGHYRPSENAVEIPNFDPVFSDGLSLNPMINDTAYT